jgi:hypothetical protein
MRSMTMMHRRHFLHFAALPLGALALFMPLHHAAMAQQTHGKPEVKLSKLRPVVKRYVEQLSETHEKNTGTGFSEEEKKKMIEKAIARLKAQGFYTYIDP